METITDHTGLISALGGNKAVSDHFEAHEPISVSAVRVGQWKLGNRIPVECWPGVIAMAQAKGLLAINSEWLMNSIRPRLNAGADADRATAA